MDPLLNGQSVHTIFQYLSVSFPQGDLPYMAMSPGGDLMVLGGKGGLFLVNLDDPWELVPKFHSPKSTLLSDINALDWSKEPTVIATGNRDALNIWKYAESFWKPSCRVGDAHRKNINSMAWHPLEPTTLSTCSIDETIKIWDTRDKPKATTTLRYRGGSTALSLPTHVSWNRFDSYRLASVHYNQVIFWDIRRTSEPDLCVRAGSASIVSFDWSYRDKNMFLTASSSTQFKLWSLEAPRESIGGGLVGTNIVKARFTPFGHGLAVIGANNFVQLFTIQDPNVPVRVRQYSNQIGTAWDFGFRRAIVSGCTEYQLAVWYADASHLRLFPIEPTQLELCGHELSASQKRRVQNDATVPELFVETQQEPRDGPAAVLLSLEEEFDTLTEIGGLKIDLIDKVNRRLGISIFRKTPKPQKEEYEMENADEEGEETEGTKKSRKEFSEESEKSDKKDQEKQDEDTQQHRDSVNDTTSVISSKLHRSEEGHAEEGQTEGGDEGEEGQQEEGQQEEQEEQQHHPKPKKKRPLFSGVTQLLKDYFTLITERRSEERKDEEAEYGDENGADDTEGGEAEGDGENEGTEMIDGKSKKRKTESDNGSNNDDEKKTTQERNEYGESDVTARSTTVTNTNTTDTITTTTTTTTTTQLNNEDNSPNDEENQEDEEESSELALKLLFNFPFSYPQELPTVEILENTTEQTNDKILEGIHLMLVQDTNCMAAVLKKLTIEHSAPLLLSRYLTAKKPSTPNLKRREVAQVSVIDRKLESLGSDRYETYIIRPGDTIAAIAIRTDMTKTELRKINDIHHSGQLLPGRVVIVKKITPTPEGVRKGPVGFGRGGIGRGGFGITNPTRWNSENVITDLVSGTTTHESQPETVNAGPEVQKSGNEEIPGRRPHATSVGASSGTKGKPLSPPTSPSSSLLISSPLSISNPSIPLALTPSTTTTTTTMTTTAATALLTSSGSSTFSSDQTLSSSYFTPFGSPVKDRAKSVGENVMTAEKPVQEKSADRPERSQDIPIPTGYSSAPSSSHKRPRKKEHAASFSVDAGKLERNSNSTPLTMSASYSASSSGFQKEKTPSSSPVLRKKNGTNDKKVHRTEEIETETSTETESTASVTEDTQSNEPVITTATILTETTSSNSETSEFDLTSFLREDHVPPLPTPPVSQSKPRVPFGLSLLSNLRKGNPEDAAENAENESTPAIQQVFKAKMKYVDVDENEEYYYIPGQLTLTQQQFIFEPNLDDPRVKKFGSLYYTLAIDIDLVSDVMIIRPMDSNVDSSKKAYLMVGLDEEDNIYYFCLKKERAQMICNQMEGWMATEHEQNLVDHLNLDETKKRQKKKAYKEEDSEKSDDRDDLYFGALLGNSQLLDKKSFKKLRNSLPARLRNYNWKLLFTTSQDGTSLQTFYSRVQTHGGATILVIEDTNGYVFGGYASEPWEIADHFFGTGECFVFSIKPKFFAYKWTGGNEYYLHATNEFIGMGGGGSGRYALYIDCEFNWGTSETSNTFLNRRLSCNEEFSATVVEVWGFTTADQ